MHAAQVLAWGSAPQYLSVPSPTPPFDPSLVQLKVLAAGLHRVVRSRASGQHYSSSTLPHNVGIDGVGLTPDGQEVYFAAISTDGGSYRDTVIVPREDTAPLPADADRIKIAALVNPGLSSWMALQCRCENLPEGFSVLIIGVTSTSGRLAVQVARALGAKRVVGIARDVPAMEALQLDRMVQLNGPGQTDWKDVGPVDAVLDYVYGPPTVEYLKTLTRGRKVQYVHIGSLAGGVDIMLPGAVLRSTDLTIRGSGQGSFGGREMRREVRSLVEAIGKFGQEKIRVYGLNDVEKVWGESSERVVFVP
ncbi:hypothetical protein MMC34_003564 [Xylographa carneopallida]|nr:hypothetical protein [Xylographa carneopallida]